ncbi:hypothetical protein GGF32_002307, partial [Allomyces javanicus]
MSASAPAEVVGAMPPPEVVVADGDGGRGGPIAPAASAHEQPTDPAAANAMDIDVPANGADQPETQPSDHDDDQLWRDHRGRRVRHVTAGFKIDDIRMPQTTSESHKDLLARAARVVPRTCASAHAFRVERLGKEAFVVFDVFDESVLRDVVQAGLPIAPGAGANDRTVAVRNMTVGDDGSGLRTIRVLGLSPQWTRGSLLDALHGAKCDVLRIAEFSALDKAERKWTALLVCSVLAHDAMLQKRTAVLGNNIVRFVPGSRPMDEVFGDVRSRGLWLHGLPRGYTDVDLHRALPMDHFEHVTVLRTYRDKKVNSSHTAEVLCKSGRSRALVQAMRLELDGCRIFATDVGVHVCYVCGSPDHRMTSCDKPRVPQFNWSLLPRRGGRGGHDRARGAPRSTDSAPLAVVRPSAQPSSSLPVPSSRLPPGSPSSLPPMAPPAAQPAAPGPSVGGPLLWSRVLSPAAGRPAAEQPTMPGAAPKGKAGMVPTPSAVPVVGLLPPAADNPKFPESPAGQEAARIARDMASALFQETKLAYDRKDLEAARGRLHVAQVLLSVY